MASTITINVDNLTRSAPLYSRYATQCTPQPAFVEMDETGNVSADYSGEIGNAVPSYVWHGRTLRWPVSSCVNGPALADTLEELRTSFAELHDQHTIEWDGSNYVGRLTEKGSDIRESIEIVLSQVDEDHIWSAGEYLSPGHIDNLWPVGTTLSSAVASIIECAKSDGIVIEDTDRIAGNLRDMLARHVDSETFAEDLETTGRIDDVDE